MAPRHRRTAPVEAAVTIHACPDEVLEPVFSFLSHRGRRQAAQVCRRWSKVAVREGLMGSVDFEGVLNSDIQKACTWLAKRAGPHVQQLKFVTVGVLTGEHHALMAAALARCTQLRSAHLHIVGSWLGLSLPALEALRCYRLEPTARLPGALTLLHIDNEDESSQLPLQLSSLVHLRDLDFAAPASPGQLTVLSRLSGLQPLSLPSAAPFPSTLRALGGLTELVCKPSHDGGEELLLSEVRRLRGLRSLTLVSSLIVHELPGGNWLKGLRFLAVNWAVLFRSQEALSAAENLEQLHVLVHDTDLVFNMLRFFDWLQVTPAALLSLSRLLLPNASGLKADTNIMACYHNSTLRLQASRPSLFIEIEDDDD